MEFMTVEDVTTALHLKNSKTIYNWLYSGSLPRSITVKIGKNLFFIKEKFEDFITKQNEEQLHESV